MDRRTSEIMTRLFLNKTPFIADEWELNPVTMYYEHKTKQLSFCTAGKDDEQKIPYMLSAKYVHEQLNMAQTGNT
jgi:hypothetical protein